mmetsp:Transcript_31029/g.96014  ORF Transcript_31029/g.96014 Transcript_31029/m.96014 type:complete len:102 (+) Transcript_31029:706-1011(+)
MEAASRLLKAAIPAKYSEGLELQKNDCIVSLLRGLVLVSTKGTAHPTPTKESSSSQVQCFFVVVALAHGPTMHITRAEAGCNRSWSPGLAATCLHLEMAQI